ncbi:hypothetical protein AKJ16_DCAP06104 [Drosera capensis]
MRTAGAAMILLYEFIVASANSLNTYIAGSHLLKCSLWKTRVRAAQASNWCDQIDIVLIYTSPVVFRAR